ncbi:SGNH/GDSL hydrolase family protein [Bacteroides sp. f07]|uniref:SGNH/GDSL hydrolase family protein n=1 Tax=Bacteroides sp. f07 TaxID=3132704 RepID=UPI0036F23412
MKRIIGILAMLLLVCHVYAQIVYHDAANFPLLGKATNYAGARYERFPDSLKNISRAPLWNLSRNSAGMAIRFRSNSTRIAVKWKTLFDNHMNHMTDVGVKGLDLYCLQKNGSWRFVNSARPAQKMTQTTIIENMKPEEREFMLYLPLYDGVSSLSIGIDSLSVIGQPMVDCPVREKPVVFYGTSILQGGCASRPGMAHTNIISRRLNRECINLGFSGNALLDLEVAEMMAEIDASVFVLDFAPNASVEQIKERMAVFYQTIRDKHPKVPILFIEDPVFTHALFDEMIAHEVEDRNRAVNEVFNTLKKKGEKNMYLVRSSKMLGEDGEATVDGVHFTDLGMMRYADLVCPVIRRFCKL